MWSMGVIMFLLLYGYPPFKNSSRKRGGMTTEERRNEIFREIKKGFTPEVRVGYGRHFPKDLDHCVSKEAKDMIANLLKTNPVLLFFALFPFSPFSH